MLAKKNLSEEENFYEKIFSQEKNCAEKKFHRKKNCAVKILPKINFRQSLPKKKLAQHI